MYSLQQSHDVQSRQHLVIFVVEFLGEFEDEFMGVLEERVLCELEEFLEESLEVLILHREVLVEEILSLEVGIDLRVEVFRYIIEHTRVVGQLLVE